MGSGLSMSSRGEVTHRYAVAYAKASKKAKSKVLDEVVSVSGWSRDNARRRLVTAADPTYQVRRIGRADQATWLGYSCDALRVLRQVGAASGGTCEKHLAASMSILSTSSKPP
jgi:hypothetical protein